jgi:hypothetical protein
MTGSLRRRPVAAAAKISFAILLAVVASWLLIAPGEITERLASYENAGEWAQSQVDVVGVATFGGVYLNAARPEHLNRAFLRSFDKALDPASGGGVTSSGEPIPRGGLFVLRKSLESMAGFLLIALLVLSVIHALITGFGAADNKLKEVAIRFFVVLFLLWFYPMWDYLLFRGLVIPLEERLTSPATVYTVTSSIARATGGDQFIADDIRSKNADLISVSSQMYQSKDACATALGAASQGGSDAALDVCVSPEQPNIVTASNAKAAIGSSAASLEETKGWLGRLGSSTASLLNRSMERVSSSYQAVGAAASAIANPLSYIADALTSTFIGLLMALESIVINIMLWFAWIGVLVARMFSLTLAPIALAWGMMPGAGLEGPKKWFLGHAKIVTAPLGLAFGLLIFYSVQAAIMATPIGPFPLSIGYKLASVFILFFALKKGVSFSSLAAGDVTKVAAEIGESVKTVTTQVTVGTVKAAAVAGGAALGGMVGGPGGAVKGAQVGARAAGTLSAAGGKDSTLAEPFNPARAGTFQPGNGPDLTRSEPGKIRKFLGKTKDAVSAINENTPSYEEAKGFAAPLKVISEPIKGSMEAYKKARSDRQEELSNRKALVGDQTLDELNTGRDQRYERVMAAREQGLDPRVRANEQVTVSMDGLEIVGRDQDDQAFANALGTEMINRLVENGIKIHAEVDLKGDVPTITLEGEAIQALISEMEGDPAGFGALVETEALRVWGSEDKIPRVAGRNGPIVDVRKLLEHSTAFANAATVASRYQDRHEEELFRREQVSTLAETAPDSIHDLAVREMDPSLARPLGDETDFEASARISREGGKVMRMAQYLELRDAAASDPAVAQQLQGMGYDHTADLSEELQRAANDQVQMSPLVAAWRDAGSATSISAETRSALSRATAIHAVDNDRMRQRTVLHNGTPVGLDVEAFQRYGREEYQNVQVESLMHEIIQLNPALASDSKAAYERARAVALADPRCARQPDESDVDYTRRVEPIINHIVLIDRT